jgi:hypothetical protein
VRFVRLFAVLTLLSTASAYATVFAPMTDRDLIDRSDAIVIGTVTAETARIGAAGYVHTDYRLSVEQVIKGRIGASLVISELGGSLAGKFTVVEGAPKYVPGTQVLAFLRQAEDGTYYTAGMSRGAFKFAHNIGGEPVVVRDLMEDMPNEPVRLRDRFIAYVRTVASGGVETDSYISASPEKLQFVPAVDGNAKNYALTASGSPVRWLCGSPTATPCTIPFTYNGASVPSALTSGAAQWTNDPNAVVSLTVAAGTGTLNPDDCKNTILVQSPLPSDARCDGSVACTLGTGGSSGVGCPAGSLTHAYDGDTWVTITDADIVFSPGTESNPPIATHELGHAIGIRHSNQGTPSSTQAVMATPVNTTGAGTLQQWDKDAVDSLYGNGPVAPPCKAVTAVTLSAPSTVNSGTTAKLSASNDGDAPFTYQWFKGAATDTSNPLTTTTTNSTDTPPITTTSQFWVKVSNCAGTPTASSVASNTVTIAPGSTSCIKPAISAQPQSQQIGSGTTATLSVGVTGSTPFGYQWYEGVFPDTSKPVATTASFTTPPLTKATSYWVHVANSCGSVDSNNASITIIGQCIAPTLTLQPASLTLTSARQVALVANSTGDAPLTFTWFNATSPNQVGPTAGLDPSDTRFIRMLYVDLLGRDPDSSTINFFLGLLGSESHQDVALNVLTSGEYRSNLIGSYYRAFLRRSPSAAETTFLLPYLSNPGTSDVDVEALILGSTEYFTGLAGGTNTNFLNQLFNDVLGRAPSASDLSFYNNLLSTGFSRSDVALVALRSTEARSRLVTSWFNDFLRRAPTSTEVATFTGLLNNGSSNEQVIAAILGGSEYSSFGSVLITPTISNQSNYWVRVTNACSGASNSATATINVASDCNNTGSPAIVTQPSNATTITGVPVFIGVGVSGAGPFAFQWFEGKPGDTSKPVSGQTSAQLQVLQNTVGTRTFWVRVTNSCSRTTNSSAATVTINCGAPAPTLSGDTTVRSGIAHKVFWTGDSSLYSSFELQVATKSDFSDAQTQTIPAGSLSAGALNEKSFTDTASTDTRFYYRVRGKAACNGQFSEYSRPVSTVVTAPPPANTTNIVLTVGGNTTTNVVTQDLFIPGFATAGKMALATVGSFTVTSDRDFVTITPSSGPLPAEGVTVKVSIDTAKVGIGATQATLVIKTNDGLGKIGTLGASRTTSTSVSAARTTPVSSTPKDSNAPADTLIVLAVGHGLGASGPFQSDVRVTNVGASALNYQLTFTPAATDGTLNGKQTQVPIASGETKALNDIVAAWFGAGGLGEANLGTLEVRPLATASTGGSTTPGVSRTVASSLTYFVKQDGSTFGQYIPALPLSQFISSTAASKMSIQQIQQNASDRTNIGLVEGSGQPATAELKLLDKNNNQIGIANISLRGFEFVQRALTDYFPGVTTDDARLEVKVTSPNGKVSGYASVVENKTSDPTLVFPKITNQLLANRYVVPGVANALGANNSNFHTDMRIYNAGTTAVPVTMSYKDRTGATATPFTFTLQPGQIQTFTDVVKEKFNVTNSGAFSGGGAIIATTQSNSTLVLTGRTYSIAADGGTYGQFIPGVTSNDAIALNESAMNVTQLEQSPGFRSNLGLVEVTGQPVTVRLSVYNPDAKSIPSMDVQLDGNGFRQMDQVFSLFFANSSVYNGRVSAQVIGGTGKVSVYGSLIDNRSNDPAFIPGQK